MNIGMISFAHMHAYSYAQHLKNHPDVSLTAIWDADPARGQKAAEQFGGTYYEDMDQFLEADIEAVIICSENRNHREHVIQAARAGKHILCEKPIATEIHDAKEMIAVCKEEDVILQIAFPVRFAPSVRRAKDVIQAGELGDILAVKCTNHGQMPGGWFIEKELSGGGAATDHIVHVMDLMRWMLNDEVKNVYAELDTRFYDIDVEDCGMVSLELNSGVVATIDPSWSRPKTYPTWGNVTMEFVGTNGTLSLDAFKQSSFYYNDTDHKIEQHPWAEDMDEGLVNDFISCVKTQGQPSISGEDGLRTLEVVKAAYESSESRKVVPLNNHK